MNWPAQRAPKRLSDTCPRNHGSGLEFCVYEDREGSLVEELSNLSESLFDFLVSEASSGLSWLKPLGVLMAAFALFLEEHLNMKIVFVFIEAYS